MMRRCYNVTQLAYKNYGGRGIVVALAWHDFANFLRCMGEVPEGLTLERRENHLDYEPGNCYWATPTAQARNKRSTRWVEFGDERLCLTEWAERLAIKPKTLRARLDDHGWSVERALTTPAPLRPHRRAA